MLRSTLALAHSTLRRTSSIDRARLRTVLLSLCAIGAAACSSDDDDNGNAGDPVESLNFIDTTGDPEGIVPLPGTTDARISSVFSTYAQLTAPSGDRIHFLSQSGVSREQLFRTRALLRQHIFDVPGSALGADKSSTFNQMAQRNATLGIFTDSTTYDPSTSQVQTLEGLFGVRLATLDSTTIVQEGSAAYLLPQPTVDSSIDSTSQFVLDQGLTRAVPQFQTDLDAALTNALTNNLYTPDPMTPTGQQDDEYLGLALTTYYGQWAHDPNGDGSAGANSEYDFGDRAAMPAGDPTMVAVIESYFAPTMRFQAFLEEGFTGDFELELDPVVPYTSRSQYLERVGARGALAANINGNDLDNTLVGNGGDNVLQGREGDDAIEGNLGTDTAVYRGNMADYTVTEPQPGVFQVEDSNLARDGVDLVRGIETLQFADGQMSL